MEGPPTTIPVSSIPVADRQTYRPGDRLDFAALDAVRAAATLGVVLLHSCVPYLVHPMPGLAWPIRDQPSPVIDFAFWTIELFIMPLFLIMSGFLVWQTLERRGAWMLFKTRSQRILKPLLFGMIIILPLDLYCWVLGWVSEGLVAPVKLRSLKFDAAIEGDLWGLSHLWYLLYLFLYISVVAACVWARDRFRKWNRVRPQPRLLVAMGLASGTLVLYLHPEVVWGFQHAFLPVPSKFLYSALFFGFGLMLARQDRDLSQLRAIAGRLVSPAVLFAIAAVTLGQFYLAGTGDPPVRLVLAALTCGGALLLALATIGVAARCIGQVPVVVRYVAAASFWIYLLHHPVVGLVHLDLKWLLPGAGAVSKTAIAFTLTSGLCLMTYEGLIRRSAVGRWLGMSWQPTRPPESDARIISIERAEVGRSQSAQRKVAA